MRIELTQIDDVCILRCEGRFVTGTDPEYLRGKSDEIKRQACGKVLVDFREVISVGSTAIGFLVAVYSSVTKNPDGRFVLVGAQPRVREVLDLTRLSHDRDLTWAVRLTSTIVASASSANGSARSLVPFATTRPIGKVPRRDF